MRQAIVTNGEWNFGGISGSGIPAGCVKMGPFRMRDGKLFRDGKTRFQRGDWDGVIVTHKQSDEIGLRHGYTTYFTKNYRQFIMSRAARKRGYKTDNFFYNNQVKSYHPCKCGRKWVRSGECYLCFSERMGRTGE